MSLRTITSILEGTAGFILAWVTLRDVFGTVVVSGPARGSLRISRRMVDVALPLWKSVRRRQALGANFAPLVLVASFTVWMLLLVLAFGLMVHAAADSYVPALSGFGEALHIAGASLTTIGFGRTQAGGPAAVVEVGAGFCGLAVMTLAVTYLLEVQNNIAQRDTGVLKISTTAGEPPCAIALLERYGALGCPDETTDILRRGREWCVGVLQSHVSHPSLIYFRSAGTETGWPAALATLVDVSLIVDMLVELPGANAAAALVRDDSDRLGRDLGALLGLEPAPNPVTARDVEALRDRLAAAGYRLRRDADLQAFVTARGRHVGPIDALSRHLGAPLAPLLPRSSP
jgi:hypothetical protein